MHHLFYNTDWEDKPLALVAHSESLPHPRGYWSMASSYDGLLICPNLKKILLLPFKSTLRLRSIFKYLDNTNLAAFKKWLRKLWNQPQVNEPLKIRIMLGMGVWKWLKLTIGVQGGVGKTFHGSSGIVEDITNEVNNEKSIIEVLNHEIRNPLAVIKLNAQLFAKAAISNKSYTPATLASVIVKNVEAITMLLERYLDNGKAKKTYGFSYFDIGELIASTLEDFRMLHNGFEFLWPSSQRHIVYGDKSQIGQVLINYLNNAIKFSPKDSRITVLTNFTISGIEVGISDEGIGINSGEEKKIFERFYQSDPGSGDRSSMGLGLYLVREVIHAHRGRVWVQRSRSGGSIFFFSLPEATQEHI
ncbi:sensor histidine kinase [Pedobacter miscanthi]|uniref:histidine kinase n=1 Tax=Pedobacter miscanthi TaxID=2259170 RepID=A0A366KYR1_9SPHI|nr:HAMP domain-containing sensor histidine kinase [Pedobacter miscanthi]RBQ06767.1 hypothetical protein DRW42_13405 [Pedobacter miscanthi]